MGIDNEKHHAATFEVVKSLRAELDAANAEIARLREGLQKISGPDLHITDLRREARRLLK